MSQTFRSCAVDGIALTKLDVLDDFDEIPVCTGYRINGQVLRDLPPDQWSLESVEPVLHTMKGWKTSTVGILDESELPPAARDYIEFIEQEIGAPCSMISTGPAPRGDADPRGRRAGRIDLRPDGAGAGAAVAEEKTGGMKVVSRQRLHWFRAGIDPVMAIA